MINCHVGANPKLIYFLASRAPAGDAFLSLDVEIFFFFLLTKYFLQKSDKVPKNEKQFSSIFIFLSPPQRELEIFFFPPRHDEKCWQC